MPPRAATVTDVRLGLSRDAEGRTPGVGAGAKEPNDLLERVLPGSTASIARKLSDSFADHQLMIAAGGIAFRVFLGLVTGLLFVIGLLGFLGLEEVWRQDVLPELRGSVSEPVFKVVNTAVERVLTGRAMFWTTAGAVIAVWQISGVVRATGQTLNRVYGDEDDRSFWRELAVSIATGAAIVVLVITTIAVVFLGPLALDHVLGTSAAAEIVGFVVRWAIALTLLLVIVGLTARFGPVVRRPIRRITLGSALTVAAWILTTLLFGLYVTHIADFGSVYWALLTAYLLAEYLFALSVAFLAGLVTDRILDARSDA